MRLALVGLVVLVVPDDSTRLVAAVVIKSQSRRELWEDALQLVLGQVRSRLRRVFLVDLICPDLEDVLHVDRILGEVPLSVVIDDILLRIWNLFEHRLARYLNSFPFGLTALLEQNSALQHRQFSSNIDVFVRPGSLELLKDLMEVTFTEIESFCFHHYGCVNVVWCGKNLLNDDFLRMIPELRDDLLFIFPELVSQMLAQK
jgi:hypothetical protein